MSAHNEVSTSHIRKALTKLRLVIISLDICFHAAASLQLLPKYNFVAGMVDMMTPCSFL